MLRQLLKKIIKEIFFNNIGLTCNFTELILKDRPTASKPPRADMTTKIRAALLHLISQSPSNKATHIIAETYGKLQIVRGNKPPSQAMGRPKLKNASRHRKRLICKSIRVSL